MLFTRQNESSDSSPDTENENEDENQNEEFIQTSNEHRFESTRAMLLQIRQIQTKWEVSFSFAFCSSSKDGCLCKLCSEYGEGDDFWRSKAVKLHELPNWVFSKHAGSLKHKVAEKKKIKIEAMIAKGNIHKQMCDGKKTKPREKRPNTPSHKKVF